MSRVLIAEDDEAIREFFVEALEDEGLEVAEAEDGQAAWELLQKQSFHLVLTDLRMPRMDGLELLRRVRAQQPEVPVVVLTAHGNVDTAVEAMREGAFDFLQKPLRSPGELRMTAKRALERRKLADLEERVEAESQGISAGMPPLSYGDPGMQAVEAAAAKVARTEATVLLLGESGTGKEVAARRIHAQSPRAEGPFLAVNCAALTESLLESELFGHEKGAFTGASDRRRGRIELAAGGTFFLDEVGELALPLQAKLLRVLQERRFERLGGAQTLEADVRWVAATNRDLPAMIARGDFREDLYHRLSVFPIQIPPLRDRPGDVIPLAEALLPGICADLKRPLVRLSPAASTRLETASWPGNVRELRNVLERALILAEGSTLEVEDLILEERISGGSLDRPQEASGVHWTGTLEELERRAIEVALEDLGGNREKAAHRLGIGVRTLYSKLKKYRLEG